MFNAGDFVTYGSTGVCRVEGTTIPDFAPEGDRLYYVLRPVYQNGTIFTPVEGGKVPMRSVISKEKAEKLIDIIPSVKATAYYSKAPMELSQKYGSMLSSYDCIDLIELTMSIYAKKQDAAAHKKKVGAVDERYMTRAEELLFGELSVALGIKLEEVQDYIADRVEQLGKEDKESVKLA